MFDCCLYNMSSLGVEKYDTWTFTVEGGIPMVDRLVNYIVWYVDEYAYETSSSGLDIVNVYVRFKDNYTRKNVGIIIEKQFKYYTTPVPDTLQWVHVAGIHTILCSANNNKDYVYYKNTNLNNVFNNKKRKMESSTVENLTSDIHILNFRIKYPMFNHLFDSNNMGIMQLLKSYMEYSKQQPL